jgi:hypothetical protein
MQRPSLRGKLHLCPRNGHSGRKRCNHDLDDYNNSPAGISGKKPDLPLWNSWAFGTWQLASVRHARNQACRWLGSMVRARDCTRGGRRICRLRRRWQLKREWRQHNNQPGNSSRHQQRHGYCDLRIHQSNCDAASDGAVRNSEETHEITCQTELRST